MICGRDDVEKKNPCGWVKNDTTEDFLQLRSLRGFDKVESFSSSTGNFSISNVIESVDVFAGQWTAQRICGSLVRQAT